MRMIFYTFDIAEISPLILTFYMRKRGSPYLTIIRGMCPADGSRLPCEAWHNFLGEESCTVSSWEVDES